MVDFSDFKAHNPTFEDLHQDQKNYEKSIGKLPFTTRVRPTYTNLR